MSKSLTQNIVSRNLSAHEESIVQQHSRRSSKKEDVNIEQIMAPTSERRFTTETQRLLTQHIGQQAENEFLDAKRLPTLSFMMGRVQKFDILQSQFIKLERRQEEFEEKMHFFSRHCKQYLTSIDLSNQWKMFSDQIQVDVDSKLDNQIGKVLREIDNFALKVDMKRELDEKAEAQTQATLFKEVNFLSMSLSPLVKNSHILTQLCDSIINQADSGEKLKTLEREIELYNVRIRGILTEHAEELKELETKAFSTENNINQLRKELLGFQQSKMFKEATSKTATVFEGMQNINMSGGYSFESTTPLEKQVQIVAKKETQEQLQVVQQEIIQVVQNTGYQMSWDIPNEIDLTIKRDVSRNIYGYGQAFVDEIDLFGEKDLHDYKGTKSAYTPQNMIKYLQFQINEICKEHKKEQNLSEQFREEFSGLRSFKFFTEKLLTDVEDRVKKMQNGLNTVTTVVNSLKSRFADSNNNQNSVQESINILEIKVAGIVSKTQALLDEMKEEMKTKYSKTMNTDQKMDHFQKLLEFEVRQRRDMVQLVQKTIAPVNKFQVNLDMARKEIRDGLLGVELKLNKSVMVLAHEMDCFREPLGDHMQQIKNERELIANELERTQYTNRQLILQNCKRPNIFDQKSLNQTIVHLAEQEQAKNNAKSIFISGDTIIEEEQNSQIIDFTNDSSESLQREKKITYLKEKQPHRINIDYSSHLSSRPSTAAITASHRKILSQNTLTISTAVKMTDSQTLNINGDHSLGAELLNKSSLKSHRDPIILSPQNNTRYEKNRGVIVRKNRSSVAVAIKPVFSPRQMIPQEVMHPAPPLSLKRFTHLQ